MTETPNKEHLIVFIDDDGGVMDFYEEALEDAGYKIERIQELPKALTYIQNTKDKPNLWLVDVMMPVVDEKMKVDGVLLSEASNWGLTSGHLLYRQIRKRVEFKSTPLILFTNVPNSQILNDLEKEIDSKSICESKIMLTPSALVELVGKFLEANAASK